MHKISIDASPSQLRKLRKGLPVRVKKGTGFNIIVQPHTYNRVSRAFAKNKGLELALSQEELKNNEENYNNLNHVEQKGRDYSVRQNGL